MLPDRFVDHGTPDGMYADAGLTADDIDGTVVAALGRLGAAQEPARA